ncbi:MAG: MFS transporter [Pacificimonas sp.]|jgi:MFS family permease|nr:MFS transporter [Pacificimonas sp.]
MTTALRPVAALLFSVALLLMGNGLQGALLPLRASIEDYSTFSIGFLASSYFAGFVSGCIVAPSIIGRVGHIRAFTAAVSLVSATALLHALIIDPVAWWLLRAVAGLCFAVLFTVIESWLSEKSTNENRGTVFSVYTVINLTVITLGQLLMVLGDPAAFPLFAVASVLLSVAAIPVAMTSSEAPGPVTSTRIRLGPLFDRSPAAFVGSVSVGLANGSFWALGPILAAERSGTLSPADMVAWFMSAAVIGGALGQFPLGRLSDRMDRRLVLVGAALAAAGAGLGLALAEDAFPGATFVFALLFGMFSFPIYAVSVAHMNDNIDASAYVEAASGLLLLYGLGAVAGPILSSVIVAQTSIDALFLFTAAVHAAMFVYLWSRIFRRSAPAADEQVDFGDSVLMAQTISTVETATE